jgi:hypothetical protein
MISDPEWVRLRYEQAVNEMLSKLAQHWMDVLEMSTDADLPS